MRVMVIVKATKDSEAGVLPSTELLTEMGQFNEELVKSGVLLSAEGLRASAHGVRVRFRGGKNTVIDGPFTESKELIAGFWIWQASSIHSSSTRAYPCTGTRSSWSTTPSPSIPRSRSWPCTPAPRRLVATI